MITELSSGKEVEEGVWEPKTVPAGSGMKQTSRSEEQKNLFSALVKAQSTMSGAKKDALNPHFKSKYADLAAVWDAIREPLTSNGLCLLQELHPCESGVLLEVTLAHTSGEWRSSTAYFPVEAGKINNPQAMMSTLTYARRGQIMALMSVCPEDDDGNAGATAKAPPPDEKVLNHQKAVREHLASVLQIQEALALDDYETAAQGMAELDRDTQIALWSLAPTKGGVFTTRERDKMKSDEWTAAMKLFHGESASEEP
jgi:hypothetical protein